MHKMFLLGAVAIIIVATVTAGCTSEVQSGINQVKTVPIGALLPFTGTAASTAANVNSTIRVADADVNSYLATTNSNVRVQLVVIDTGTTREGALAAMQALYAEGVTAVVGPYSSAELTAIAPYANENGMVLVSYGSSVPTLGVPRENVFRVVPDDSHQGPALSSIMRERGVRLLIPFVRDDVYGNGLVNSTRTAFEQKGGIVAEGLRFPVNTTNFTDVLDAAQTQLTQATATYGQGSVGILFIGFENNTVPMLITASSDSQWSAVPWFGVAATPINVILVNGTAAEAAARLNYIAVQQVEGKGERYDRLMQNASVQGTVQTPYGSFAYDAVQIIARAIAKTNGGNSTALRAAIPRIANSYIGVTGNTTLNAVGDRAYANYDFWTIRSQNGMYVKVKIAEFRTDSLSEVTAVQLSTTTSAER